MFILLPVPKRSAHLPPSTIFLIVVNILLFLIAWPIEKRSASTVSREEWQEAAQHLVKIALAEDGIAGPERAILDQEQHQAQPSQAMLAAFDSIQNDRNRLGGAERFKWDELYPRFEAMTRSVAAARDGETPYRIFGFRPSRSWFPGILTHQFLHAGFWHLFFNMLFLWVIGTVLEPVVGFHFLWIYLLGGVAAAMCQTLSGQLGTDFMVGASGAVATMMGFGLFAIPSAVITLFYFVFLMLSGRAGTFEAPLWSCLPLWIGQQLFMAGMTFGYEMVRVGYWAHIGGFAFGALLALLIRSLRWPFALTLPDTFSQKLIN